MPSEDKKQHYTLKLTLTREFLKWIYSHRLVHGPTFQHLWDDKPATQEFLFGGKYGNQFETVKQVKSFNNAFDSVLAKFNIDKKHKHSLLYIILFLGADSEKQSIDNNWNNHLLVYSKFIIDLISDSLAHMESMRRNSKYEEVNDIYTLETFFAKKELVESMPYEELITYVPDVKQADDVVKYNRINIYDQQLHVPYDLIINIQSNEGRMIKSGDGSRVANLELPHNILLETFNFMVGNMLDLHKKRGTEFYRDMINDNTTLKDLVKSVSNKYKKHTVSNVKSLAIVGTILTDYLLMHKLFTSKRSVAAFLFEYFALFKAINLKKQPQEFPTNYDELIPFYRDLGVDGEKLRNQMKDVGEI